MGILFFHYLFAGIFMGWAQSSEPFYEKIMSDRVILIPFGLGPIYKLFKSVVHFAVRWISRFLGPIKISNGP